MKNRRESATQYGASQVAASVAAPWARSADEMKSGMDLFREAAKRLQNVDPDIRKGKLFEYLEVAKFNREAAFRGSRLRAYVMAEEGKPTSPHDVEIRNGNRIVAKVQMKASDKPSRLVRELSDPKYRDMIKVVPKDKVARVRVLAENRAGTGNLNAEDYKDTAANVRGSLSARGVDSKGSSSPETDFSGKRSNLYATGRVFADYGKEVAVTAGAAAAAAAITTGALSIARNAIAMARGEEDMGEASTRVASDLVRAAERGALVGAATSAIRVGATRIGAQAIAKEFVAGSLGSALIDTCTVVYAYAKGSITADEAREALGGIGVSSVSGIYTGAVAGAFFGPPGILVGSIVGYIAGTNLYHSCIAILKHAQLAEAEAERVIALCEASVKALSRMEDEFGSRLEEFLKEKRSAFDACFALIDKANETGSPEQLVEALSNLAGGLGKVLGLQGFESFDAFMLDKGSVLVL